MVSRCMAGKLENMEMQELLHLYLAWITVIHCDHLSDMLVQLLQPCNLLFEYKI